MYRVIMKLIFILSFSLILISCSNGSNTNNSSNKNDEIKITKKTDFNKIQKIPIVNKFAKSLSSLNIKNTEELVKKVNSEEKINFFLKLKANNKDIQAEDFRRLLRSLEDEIVWKNLLTDKILTSKEYDSLKTTNKLISNLKQGEFHIFSTFNKDDKLSPSGQERYLKEQLIPFNNNLASYGKELFTIEEFKKLKEKVSSLDNMFLDNGEALQNVVKKDVKKSTRSNRAISTNLNYTILNPIQELKLDKQPIISEYEKEMFQNILCNTKEQDSSFDIVSKSLKSGAFIQVASQENKFYVNKKALARITLYNNSNENKTIEIKHRDKTIFSNIIPAKKYAYTFLPILGKDICSEYSITNSEDIRVRVNLDKITKLEKKLDTNSGNYYFTTSLSYYNYSTESKIFEFLLSNVSSQKAILSKIDQWTSSDNLERQYILVSPSNKMYIGELSSNTDIKFDEEVGKWTLIALTHKKNGVKDKFKISQEDSANITNLGLNYISTLPLIVDKSDKYLNQTIKISINDKTNRKKFIIGEMKKAEFATDGDDDDDPNAEINMSINTNVAPKLQLGETFDSTEFSTIRYKAYKCWIDHNKDISTFKDKGICSSYNNKKLKNSLEDNIDNMDLDQYDTKYIRYLDLKNSRNFQIVLNIYDKWFKKKMKDTRFHLIRDKYNNIYENWENNVTQINSIKFPLAYHYSITEKISGGRIHPIVPINMPMFALTKKRLSQTLYPIGFRFNALEHDEINKWALFGSLAKYIFNQALAFATGNISDLVCSTVKFMGEVRQIEKNAEDDPIGEANGYLNRFSTNDKFYGLEDGIEKLSTSGFAKISNNLTAVDKGLKYSSIVCNVAGIATAAYNLANTADNIYNGKYRNLISQLIAIINTVTNSIEIKNRATQLKEAFENGTATQEQIDEFLKDKDISALIQNGKDVFDNEEEIETLGGIGSQGYNTLTSEAKYYYSDFGKAKTRGVYHFKEVDSIPIRNINVNLNKVYIKSNYEDGDAEVKLRTRVGVVSDKAPSYRGRFSNSAPFMLDGELLYENGSNDYKTLPNLPFKGYLLRSENFNGVKDNTNLDLSNISKALYSASYPSDSNVAAIYVEIGIYEGDGGGVDDDMIGVLSKTYYLEDIFNNANNIKWKKISNTKYKLIVKDYPIYTTANLQSSVEILDKTKRAFQEEHNRTAKNNPSAKISFDITVNLGDFVENEVVEIKDYLDKVTFNSQDDVLDTKNLNLKELNSLNLENTKLFAHNKDKTRYIMYGNNTISIVKLDEHKNLSLEKTLKREKISSYTSLWDAPDRKIKIKSINFIDKDNIVIVYNYHNSKYGDSSQMAIIDINNSRVSKLINLEKEDKVYFQNIEDRVRYFLLSKKINTSTKGNISLYSIDKNGENRLISKDIVVGIPTEIDFINKNNILVTIIDDKNSKKHYTLYKIDNSSLKETDVYEYDVIKRDDISAIHIQMQSGSGIPQAGIGIQEDIAQSNNYYQSKHNLWYFENRDNHNAYVDVNDSKSRVLRSFNLLYNSANDTYSFDGVQDKNIKESFYNKKYQIFGDKSDIEFTDDDIFTNKNANIKVINHFMIDDRYMFVSTSIDNANKQYKVIDTRYVKYSSKPKASITQISKSMETLKEYSFKASVEDADADDKFTYLWTATNKSSQSITMGKTKDLNYTFKKGGQYTISFKVTDLKGNIDTVSKEVTVNSVPKIISISPSTNQRVKLNQTLNFSANFEDVDGDDLSYYWNYGKVRQTSSGAIVEPLGSLGDNKKDGSFTFTSSGTYVFEFRVKDKVSNYITKAVQIEVENSAPTITNISPSTNQTIKLNQTVNFSASFKDVDGDELSYNWQYTKDGTTRSFDKNKKDISFRFNSSGNYIFKFRVKDAKSEYVSKSVQITVKSSDVFLELKDINFTIHQNEGIKHKTSDTNVLKISAFENPKHGTVSYDNSSIPSFKYSAEGCYIGSDSFIYILNEKTNKSKKYGKVNIKIDALQMDYQAQNKKHNLLSNQILENQTLMKVDSTLSFKITKAPQHGKASLSISADKSTAIYSYDPKDDYDGKDSFEYSLTQTKNSCSKTVKGKIEFVVKGIDTRLIQYCKEPNIGYELYKTDMDKTILLVKDISEKEPVEIVNTNIHIKDSIYLLVNNQGQKVLWSSKGTDADTKSYDVLLNSKENLDILHKDNNLIFIGKRVSPKDSVYEVFKIENDELQSVSEIKGTLSVDKIFVGEKYLYFITTKDSKLYLNRTDGKTVEELTIIDNQIDSLSNIGDTLLFSTGGKLYSLGADKKLIDLSKKDFIYQFIQKDMYKIGDKIYFSAINQGSEQRHIFQTDGTVEGTKKIYDFNGPINRIYFNQLVLGDKLIFLSKNFYGGKTTFTLHSFDTKTKILSTLKEKILEGEKVTYQQISGDILHSKDSLKDRYIFFISKEKNLSELWLSDGTQSGTKLLNSSFENGASTMNFFELNNTYYLRVGTKYYEIDLQKGDTKIALDDLCDMTPDDINIKILDDVRLDSVQQINFTITGITYPQTEVSIKNGEYSLDGAKNWLSDSSKIKNNQEVYIRHTSSSEYGKSTITNFTVGTKTIQFQSITTYDGTVEGKSNVLQTGQTKYYVNFDNGYYQKGIKRDFSREGDIVIDKASGLMWQDDEDAKSLRKGVYASINHCKGLTLGGYSVWRLPTYNELENIVDYGKYKPSLNPIFKNTGDGYYWTRTVSALDSDKNWYISFNDDYEGVYTNTKAFHFRCVRDIK